MPVREQPAPVPEAAPAPPGRAPAGVAPPAPATGAVLALQRAAGNTAVGAALARQPTKTKGKPKKPKKPKDGELTQEEWDRIKAAAAAKREQAHAELRARVLAPLDAGDAMRFIADLRRLDYGERTSFRTDAAFWKALRARFSGLALWAVQLAVEYGSDTPPEVRELSTAVHEAAWRRTRDLLMGYPSLKTVPGVREAIRTQFAGAQATDLAAVLAEPDGMRAESGPLKYKEAHYEDGKMDTFTGVRNFELVRYATTVRVIVRIRAEDDPATKGSLITDALVAKWEDGIGRRWNNRFRLRNGAQSLDVWFVPVFVFGDAAVHHTVKVLSGDARASEHKWYAGDDADTAAHEFGHMLGNPDEYNLPGATAEIPAKFGLSAAEAKRSSWEGLFGAKKSKDTDGYDVKGLMGNHYKSTAVAVRHAQDVLDVFNAQLRKPGEAPWTLELR